MKISKTTPEDRAGIIEHRKLGKSLAELRALYPDVSERSIVHIISDAGLRKTKRNVAATLKSFLNSSP